jgi:hypothetical protein
MSWLEKVADFLRQALTARGNAGTVDATATFNT